MHDPLTTAVAAAIADHIDYDHLAARIADHLRQRDQIAHDPDEPIEVEAIRRELGAHKRQGHIAHLTFQKRYIDTGLLKYIPGPNRARRYVRRGDWEKLKAEIRPRK